ncbi:MAG: tyrosine-protein phosphatase [Caulobacteraceae bacterium]|nr:tyrosine-protein phosphatase [Caulobacteraceae bacterium]
MTYDRHIPLEGASNFRDFGGYAGLDGRKVKWRRLFRSDHLAELTAADYAILAEHGIRVVFDLRRDSEAAALVTAWQGEAPPELIRSPLFNDEARMSTFERLSGDERARSDPETAKAAMRDLYVYLVTEPGPLAAFQRIFARLAEPGAYPLLAHCAGGKDRTGVTCALILLTLGVSREDVVEDFMLTGRYFDAAGHQARRIAQIIETSQMGGWSEAALKPLFGVDSSYIEAALGPIEAAGGAEAFLVEKVGVPAATLQGLREALLE